MDEDIFQKGSLTKHGIVIGKRGQVFFKIIVFGKTAHCGALHKGINAIEEACKVVEACKLMPIGNHPVMGICSQSVRRIFSESHSVPDECELLLFRYLVPPENPEISLQQTEVFF